MDAVGPSRRILVFFPLAFFASFTGIDARIMERFVTELRKLNLPWGLRKSDLGSDG